MEQIHASGKAKAIGISNFNATLVKDLLAVANVKPAVNQCGYSIGNHNGTTPTSFPGSMLGRDDATRECVASALFANSDVVVNIAFSYAQLRLYERMQHMLPYQQERRVWFVFSCVALVLR